MNTNLASFLTSLLPKLFEFSLNFVDDIFCLLLSHLGIHWTWLQLCGYSLIIGKIIYWLVKLGHDYPLGALRDRFYLQQFSVE